MPWPGTGTGGHGDESDPRPFLLRSSHLVGEAPDEEMVTEQGRRCSDVVFGGPPDIKEGSLEILPPELSLEG